MTRSISNKTLAAQNIENILRGVTFDALPALPDEFHMVYVAVRVTFKTLTDTTRNLRIKVESSDGTRLYIDTYRELSNGDADEVNYTAVGPFFPPASEVMQVRVSSDKADANTDLEFDLLSGDAEYYQAYSVPSAPFTTDALQYLSQTLLTLAADGGDGDLAAALALLQHTTYGVAKLMRTGADSDTGKSLSDQIDGANTITPPTVAQIQAELEEDGASLLDTIRDIVSSGTFGNSALKTLIDAIPTTKTGYALTTAERDSIAAAWLDLTNGIETGVTPRQALQRIGAVIAGKVSGAGTGSEVFVGLDNATDRVTVTVDGSGNRTAVSYV